MEKRDQHALRQHFARRIRIRRAELDITQKTLADRTGLSQTYLSGVERAKHNVSIDNIQKIVVALKLNLKAMFMDRDSE